jgi:formate dehydrogenase maturation protein FdhE
MFMSQLESKPELKRLYKDRGTERGEVLKKEFPNSPYLKG